MAETLTPMMQQYQRIRQGLPADTLLLFRLGDFYEMFFEDAKVASAILNVALTKRNTVPMCGIPHHAADKNVRLLLEAGKRVALCDQVSAPEPGKIVQREVTQIISPGTVADWQMLEAKRPNFFASVYAGPKGCIGFAYLDLTTGDFRLTEVQGEQELADELARVQPVETLVSEEQAERFPNVPGRVVRDGYTFLAEQAFYTLREHFKVQSLDGYGCDDMHAAISAAGAMVHYLRHELRRPLAHLRRLQVYHHAQFMVLDASTQAHLELVQSRGGGRDTSLLGALDRTGTPMGARLLRDWVLHPLCALKPLQDRQHLIGQLLEEPFLLGKLRETLKGIRDVERTVGRLAQASGNARDLLVLRTALEQIPPLREDLRTLCVQALPLAPEKEPDCRPDAVLARQMLQDLHELPHLGELLERALVDEPPNATKEGGMFRGEYSPQLDELRAAGTQGKEWIAQLQQREIDATGIKSLKVRYTSVFGYFIEVTKSNMHLAPERWTRKQTLATGERYVTPELKEVENKILHADERARALEFELFGQVRDEALAELPKLQATAAAVAMLDALCSLAETARLFNYHCPTLTEERQVRIVDGRHPVLDQALVEDKFVPNDVLLDGSENRLLILTGPNMAGKSTYIRQVALLVLLAQTGSWLPVASATIGLADRIFTRVGASDDLSKGQSTFMVEMNETANITNNATERSLIILDEIGRGTSTFDGLSIAWSVAEYLHDAVKARTLFATHYHELTDLARTRPGVKNYNVAVREWNEQIIFLRKIIPGGADKSYGIQVARLAGLPAAILSRARQILDNLEQQELNADGRPALAEAKADEIRGPVRSRRRGAKAGGGVEEARPQLSLF